MSQAFCHVCYGTSLTFENGVLVCDACGTQTQVFQEETEFQQGIDDVRGRRRAAGAAGGSQQLSQAAVIAQQEQQAAQQLGNAAMLYARCLQHLLKEQGQALVTKYGCSADLPGLLRQLWLSYVPSTGILEPKPLRALRNRTALSTAAAAGAHQQRQEWDDGVDDASEEDREQQQQQQQQRGATTLSGMRAAQLVEPHNMKKLLWKLLHPQATLQLCFLGCVLLRQALSLYDLLGGALDGQLPFLELPHLSMQVASSDALSALPVRCLQPQLQLDPLAFCNGCCQLGSQLGLTLPQLPGEALLLRAVKELGLPQVVYETAVQLYFLHLLDTQAMHLEPTQRRSQALPYTWLSAVLLVSIKLLYGLGSAAARQLPLLPKAPGPPAGWLAWAQQVLQQLPGVSSLPLSEQEVLELGPAKMRQYIQLCRQYMFAGQPVVPNMEDVQRLLDGWYDAADLTAGMQQQQPDPEDGSRQRENEQAASAAATLQQPTPVELQQQQRQQPCALLDLSMANSCIPNYSMTVLAQGQGSSYARLAPELAAVTFVLAAYARAAPVSLVDCARRLEKQMLAVESALKVMDQMQDDGVAAIPDGCNDGA